VDSKNVALGAFVVLTLVFASITAIEYSRGPSLTITRTSFSTTTSTETTTTTSTTVSTTSIVSVSTVTAAKSAAFALSVGVGRQDYTTNQPILVDGSVSPALSPLNVTLIVTSPASVAATATSRVSSINGSYSYTLVASGSSAWVTGVYTVTAICVAFGATETATTQFTYTVRVQPIGSRG
jgi:hypothetical protein